MFDFDIVLSKQIDVTTNLLIAGYEDTSKCYNKKTAFSYISDKMLYSLFNKNDFIKLFQKGREDAIYELFQEVAIRMCKQEKLKIPTVCKKVLSEFASANCKIFANEISINLKMCAEVFKDVENLDENCLRFITSIRHEIQHQKQKKMCIDYITGKKNLSNFNNEERAEILGYLIKTYYRAAVCALDAYTYQFGNRINETFINLNNYIALNAETLCKYQVYNTFEIGAYIKAIKFFEDLKYIQYLSYNKSVEDYLHDTTLNSQNYSYLKYENLDVKNVMCGIEIMMDLFKRANVDNDKFNKLIKLYEHIDWNEYQTYLKNQGLSLKNTNYISTLDRIV